MAANYNLGTARARIEIDGSPASKGLKTVRDEVKETRDELNNAGDTFVKSGAVIAGFGVAVAAGFGVAVKAAADFESGLNGIEAVSGATAEQMEAVRAKALQLGADTKFSAGEASSAMEELIKAGISVEDTLNGAADATVALAAAGGVDLKQAAEISANAMNQFGLAAADLPKIADKIAGAANASAIDVGEFGQSMQQAGAVANLVGLSFDDAALAIAAMGNAGIKGSDAGTSLKTFLSNLQPVTEKQIALFDELGITTKGASNQFFDAQGNIKSMAEISGVLNKATAGMSDAQKTMALETAFGSDAIRAAAIVSATGAQGFADLTAEIDKTTAADVAATRMKGLAGAVEQAKGSMETLMIQVGTPLLGVFTQITNSLTGLINKFGALSPQTQENILKAVGLVGALSLLVGGFVMMVGTIAKVVVAVQQFKAAMIALKAAAAATKVWTALTAAIALYRAGTLGATIQTWALNTAMLANPIGLVIVAIVAIVGAFILLYKNSETVRKAVDKLWQDFQRGWDIILGVVKTGVANFVVGFKAIVDFFQNLPSRVQTFVVNLVNGIIAWFQALPGRIVAFFTMIRQTIIDFLVALPARFAMGLGLVLGFIVGWQLKMLGLFIGFVTGAFNAIVNFVTTAPGKLWEFIVATEASIRLWVANMILKAIEMGTNFVNNIITFFKELPGKVQEFVTNTYNNVVAWAAFMIAKAIFMGQQFIANVVAFFKALPGNVQDFLVQTIAKAILWATDMKNKATDAGRDFFNGLVDKIKTIPDEVKGIFDKIVQAIKDKITAAFNAVKDFGSNMWEGFKKGLDMHSPSNIERAMFQINDTLDVETDKVAKQISSLSGVASTIAATPINVSQTAPGNGALAANGVVINLDFTGVKISDAQQIEKTLSNSSVLTQLTQAAKAGRR